jgi:hypothetical protein
MPFSCTDCKKFWPQSGCDKNTEEWAKAKELYPVTPKEADLNRHPMTRNEKLRLAYINNVAGKCQERVQLDPL